MKLRAGYGQATAKQPANPRCYSGYGRYAITRMRARDTIKPPNAHILARVCATRSTRSMSSIKDLNNFSRSLYRSLPVAFKKVAA